MQIRYFYTSDIDEVADKVRLQLEYYQVKNHSLDEKLNFLIEELKERQVDHGKISNGIEQLRLLMGKLDLLLEESAGILEVCEKAAVAPEQVVSQPGQQVESEQQVEPEDNSLSTAVTQLTNISNALQNIREE